MADGNDLEPAQDIDSLTFEEAFGRLDEVAASLEDGGLSLADATDRYAQGMSLVRRCNQLLDQAQLKITRLKATYDSADAGIDSPEDFLGSNISDEEIFPLAEEE